MDSLVHKFQTKKNKYIYDVNSNRAFRVSDVLHDIIDHFPEKDLKELIREKPQYRTREIKQAYKELIENHVKRGVFSSTRPRGMAYPGHPSIDSFHETCPHDQIILNVTERCNMRCRYCAYSGHYRGQRTHSDRDMPFKIASKAIEHFVPNMSENACLSFYGGEPLLKMDLIREIIDHAESLTDRKIKYSMTTNGTLLSPEIARYLKEKDFTLMVSLDGPREVHDRYRVYKTGKGSFDKIMKNLRHFKSLDEDYYRKKVIFSVVSAPPHRLK
jgi:uncharacterized protein